MMALCVITAALLFVAPIAASKNWDVTINIVSASYTAVWDLVVTTADTPDVGGHQFFQCNSGPLNSFTQTAYTLQSVTGTRTQTDNTQSPAVVTIQTITGIGSSFGPDNYLFYPTGPYSSTSTLAPVPIDFGGWTLTFTPSATDPNSSPGDTQSSLNIVAAWDEGSTPSGQPGFGRFAVTPSRYVYSYGEFDDSTWANEDNPFTIDSSFTINAVAQGDPQLIGLRGQSFQVHGIDGSIYNLITHPTIHENARFTFLTSGQCPVFNKNFSSGFELIRAHRNCFSHAGSYIGEIGFMLRLSDNYILNISVISGPYDMGFMSIVVDNTTIKPGQTIHHDMIRIKYHHTHFLSIKTPLYNFELENSDLFINQRLAANVPLGDLQSHGLLGQTWSEKVNNSSKLKFIEGEIDDYSVGEESLYSTMFAFNLFV